MALTWRNVENPDFRASLDGIRTFGSMFGDAIGGLERGLGQFDAAQDKKANNTFAMDLLKYQDPAAYKAALSSGTLFAGVDPRRLSQASIQAAGARGTELLNQKIGEFGLERDQYGFDRRKTTDANQDAAAPLIAGALTAGRQGADAFTKYMAANPALAKLGLADATALASGALEAESKGVTIDTGRQSYQQSGTRFNWEKEDRATAEQADTVLASLSKGSFDSESAITALNGMSGLSPKVYNAVLGRIGGMFPGAGGGAGSSMISAAVGGMGGGGGDPLRVMNYEAKAAGYASVPDTVKTLGDASDFALSLNRAGVKSSAMGVYQIVGDTMRRYAPKVLGDNWRSQALDFQSQDRIAQAVFNDNRGSADALRKQWVSLSAADAERVRKMPWEQARQFIAAGESSANPAALAMGISISQQGVRNANMERNANNPAVTYAKSAADNRPVTDIAAELSKDPSFKGNNIGYINEQIREVQSYARRQGKTINAAVAGDILKQSISSSLWARYAPAWLGGGDSNGGKIDAAAARRYVDEYSQGRVDNTIAANANTDQAVAAQATAKAAFDAATARAQAAVKARERGQNVDPAPLIAAANRAGAMLSAATARIGNDPAVATFQRPPPRPVATTRKPGAGPLRVTQAPPTASRREMWMNAIAPLGSD